SAWYRNSVLWLVQRAITSGTGPGKYSPNAPVTRGQMAMFLWNVSGQPAATYSHGFSDVSPDSYYNDAVSWLVENDITSGTSWDTFSPNNKVSRAQMATFLWKLVGGVYPGFIHDFYDVYEGAYYDQAVAWLVRDGITAGTGPGQFSPNQNVTRAQMAAFLNIRTCG
ncbi:MAG: S-layer homology domain-containing protein, partial [Candidatus Microthrix parvicella]